MADAIKITILSGVDENGNGTVVDSAYRTLPTQAEIPQLPVNLLDAVVAASVWHLSRLGLVYEHDSKLYYLAGMKDPNNPDNDQFDATNDTVFPGNYPFKSVEVSAARCLLIAMRMHGEDLVKAHSEEKSTQIALSQVKAATDLFDQVGEVKDG